MKTLAGFRRMSLARATAAALAVVLAVGGAGARPLMVVNCGAGTDNDNRVVNPQNTRKETHSPRPVVTGTKANKQGRFAKYRRAAGSNSLIYRFRNIPNAARHQMRLEWAEVSDCRAGARVFDIYVNGRRLLTKFDPFVKAGRRCRRAVLRVAKFPVTNNVITLELRRRGGSAPPMINYIRVYELSQQPTPTPSPTPPTTGPCAGLGVITRKSATDMTTTEWNQYVAAFNRLRQRSATGGVNVYERYSRIHLDFALHRQAAFLPWHREMLWQWDRQLAVGTPRGQTPARQPYFEWAARPGNPFGSVLSTSSRYGGNGAIGGAFGNLRSRVPNDHRVRRSYGSSALTSSATMNRLRSRVSNFNSFRVTLEQNHDAFHVRVGGDMTAFESPNDPYFYAHHAYIDKIYREWETAGNRVQTGVNLNQRMQPWGTTARQAIARGQCVQYATRRANAETPVPDKSTDPAGHQAAVNEAADAAENAAEAARQFGASEDDIELARQVTEDLLRDQGIDVAEADSR